jgi:hypothetical protein
LGDLLGIAAFYPDLPGAGSLGAATLGQQKGAYAENRISAKICQQILVGLP